MRLLQDRYELLNQLGRGGMGVVWLGHDRKLDRRVAIKFVAALSSKELQLRAQREAQLLAGISHPNLVGVYSLTTDEDNGKLGLVFDYVEGKPLSALINGVPIAPELTAKIFDQLCSGLDAVHAAGVMHRDIKPSNLIIGDNDHLTIIDFGLAKSTSDDIQRLTSTGAMLGTPAYMSPEQFAKGEVGPASDRYSAACVLYEMITGYQPFQSDSLYLVAQSHLADPVPSTDDPAFDSFFACALAKHADERFSSAAEMNEAFKSALAGKRIKHSAKTKSIAPNAVARKPSRARLVLVPISIGAVSLAIAIAIHSVQSRTPQYNRTKLDTEAQVAILDADHYIARKDYDKALQILKAAIEDLESKGGASDSEMAHLYMDYAKYCGKATNDEGFKPEESSMACEKAIPLLKDNPAQAMKVRMGLAGQYFMAGKLIKSLNTYREFLPVVEHDPAAHFDEVAGYGHTLHRLGMLKECRDWLDPRAQELTPLSEGHYSNRVRRYLARCYIDQYQPKRAIELLTDNVNLASNDDHLDDHLELAYAYAESGDVAASKKYLAASSNEDGWGTKQRLYTDLIRATNHFTDHKPIPTKNRIDAILARQDYFADKLPDEKNNRRIDRLLFVYRLLGHTRHLCDQLSDKERAQQCAELRASIRNWCIADGAMLPNSTY